MVFGQNFNCDFLVKFCAMKSSPIIPVLILLKTLITWIRSKFTSGVKPARIIIWEGSRAESWKRYAILVSFFLEHMFSERIQNKNSIKVLKRILTLLKISGHRSAHSWWWCCQKTPAQNNAPIVWKSSLLEKKTCLLSSKSWSVHAQHCHVVIRDLMCHFACHLSIRWSMAPSHVFSSLLLLNLFDCIK